MRRWCAIYVIGVVCCLVLPRLFNVYESIAILALACVCFGHRYSRELGIFLLSICWFSCFAQWQLNWFSNSAATVQEHSIIAQINSLQSNENSRFFSADLIQFDQQHFFIRKSITLYIPDLTSPLSAGEVVYGQAKIRPLWSMANPAGWDQQRYGFSQHLGYQLKITKLSAIEGSPSWRSKVFQRSVEMTQGMAQQGLFLALTFAHKALLTSEIKQQVKTLGLAHLLVISGLHISLVGVASYGLILMALRMLQGLTGINLAVKPIALLVAVIAVCGYGYLAGFTLPVRRACFMFCFAAMLLLWQRHVKAFDLWLWVLALSLLIDPLAVLSGGFWLSFLAVLALLFIARNRPRFKWPKPWCWLRPLLLFCSLQFAFLLLLSPLQLHLFQGVSALSPFYNMIAIPWLSTLLLPAILFMAILLFVLPGAGMWMQPYLDRLLQYSVEQIMVWPSVWVDVSQQMWWLWLGVYCSALLCLAFYLGPAMISAQPTGIEKGKATRPLALSVFGALLFCFAHQLYMLRAKPLWQVTVFDVGQGLSVLVRVGDKHLLYDTGFARSAHFNAANLVVLPNLKRLGVKRLSHLVISHDDNDHAGGKDVMVQQMPIDTQWHSHPLGSEQFCEANKSINLGQAVGTFLTVKGFGVGNGRNNNSCVLLLDFGGWRLLLPGDVERRAERKLVKHFADALQAEILVSPHHGSNSSSSAQFIEAVAPQYVVHSASRYNQWGMPKAQVVSRYFEAGAKQYNIANTGMLTIQPQGESLQVVRYRQDSSFRWYHMALLPFVP
ncbi:DNA internalization-related competence protein ComEC/Rec2 [Motilimonas pumila]|nr:DNA internalization-related competence protein ComEC/Rec2 [Motilimonas pumila]